MTGLPLLSIAIALPVLGSLLLLFIGNRDGSKDGLIRNITLGVSLVTFAVTLALYAVLLALHPWLFGLSPFGAI